LECAEWGKKESNWRSVKPMFGRVAAESLIAVGYAVFVAFGTIIYDTVVRDSRQGNEPAGIEAGRLRRAIEVALVGFAGLVLLVIATLHHTGADLAILASGFTLCMAAAVFLTAEVHPAPRVVRWREGRDSPRAPTT
jgi:hypothetical protein